jgi:predicted Zn-dependent protease with MMP-like domain
MFEQLRKELREIMNDLADAVATGEPGDWASYQRLVGKIEGLALAERLILDALEKIDRID